MKTVRIDGVIAKIRVLIAGKGKIQVLFNDFLGPYYIFQVPKLLLHNATLHHDRLIDYNYKVSAAMYNKKQNPTNMSQKPVEKFQIRMLQ